MLKVRYAVLTVLAILTLVYYVTARNVMVHAPQSTGCPANQTWTESQIAKWFHVPLQYIQEVKEAYSFDNRDLCQLSEKKLTYYLHQMEMSEKKETDPGIAFRMQQLSVNGIVKPDGLWTATLQRQHLLAENSPMSSSRNKPQPLSRNKWIALGPGNIGGRVRALYIHPQDTNLLFAGSVSGGLWRSTNGGVSWSVVNDFMGNLAITSIVADPTTISDVNTTVLYAGTGEGFGNIHGMRGYGIFKSTDGGRTWTHLSSTNPGDDRNWYYVDRIAINASGVIIAAASWAIYTSTDGGDTWSKTQPYPWAWMDDVKFDPNDGSKAVAGTSGGKCFYTTDTGSSWNSVDIADDAGRVELAYAKSTPNLVYASVNKNQGEIYKSTDGGASWTLVSNPKHLGGQGWYANTIWADPTDSSHLLTGGLDIHKSTDSGANWTKISTWWMSPVSPHADQHVIVSDPNYDGTNNTRVYFANDGGIYKADDITNVDDSDSNDNGWTNLNNGLAVTQFYSAAGITGSKIIGGTQDNGALIHTAEHGDLWWGAFGGGDGGFSAVSEDAGNHYYFGEYIYLQIHRSKNGAWTHYIYNVDDGIDDANHWDRSNFIAPFVLDPNDDNTMLAGGIHLWRSSNVNEANRSNISWSSIKPTIENNVSISQIAVAKGNSDIILVGYNNGAIYKTTNGTAASPSWTQIHDANNKMVLALLVDVNNTNTFYAGWGGFASENLKKSEDGGATWADISGELPEAPMRTIVQNPNHPDYLYVGTEVGIFTSEDGGGSWTTSNDGPANVSIDKLFWYDDYTLVAATYGRGVFRYELNRPPRADAGTDRTVQVSQSIDINGSGRDVDGNITDYQWKEGDTVLADTASFTYTAPDTAGVHTLTLTVTDDDNATGSDTVVIRVNAAPIANAGADQNVTEGETVTLDGSESNDTDGAIISYLWQEGNTTLSTAATFTKSDFSAGVHTLTLTVTDNDNAMDSDEMNVTVTAQPVDDDANTSNDDNGSNTGEGTGGGCTYNPHSQSIDLLMVLMMLASLLYPLMRRNKKTPLI